MTRRNFWMSFVILVAIAFDKFDPHLVLWPIIIYLMFVKDDVVVVPNLLKVNPFGWMVNS